MPKERNAILVEAPDHYSRSRDVSGDVNRYRGNFMGVSCRRRLDEEILYLVDFSYLLQFFENSRLKIMLVVGNNSNAS